MLFLIEYDRSHSKLVSFQTFTNDQRRDAYDARLEMELRYNRLGVEREVVILEALSEAAIRRTHRRYFETLEQLATLSLSQ